MNRTDHARIQKVITASGAIQAPAAGLLPRAGLVNPLDTIVRCSYFVEP